MSHRSGTVILRVPLQHGEEQEADAIDALSREPSVFVNAEGCKNEDDCAELARLAYRKLARR